VHYHVNAYNYQYSHTHKAMTQNIFDGTSHSKHYLYENKLPLNQIETSKTPSKSTKIEHLGFKVRRPISHVQMWASFLVT